MNNSLHYTGQPDHKKPGLKGNQSLWGQHKFCAGPRVMRNGRALGNDGNEPWSKLAAPLGPSGPLLIPTAATGLSNGISCVPGRGTPRSPLECSVWLSLLPGPAQKGSGVLWGTRAVLSLPCSHHFTCRPSSPWSPDLAANKNLSLILGSVCGSNESQPRVWVGQDGHLCSLSSAGAAGTNTK